LIALGGTAALLVALGWVALRVLGMAIPAPWLLFGVLIVPFSGLVFLVVTQLGGRRRLRYQEELGYRYGAGHVTAYLDETRQIVERSGAPDMVLLMTATWLPRGGQRWIRVQLWTAPEVRSEVEVRETKHEGEGIANASVYRSVREGDAEATRALVALIERAAPSRLTRIWTRVRDGLPCTVVVMDRGTGNEYLGACNLVGLSNEEEACAAAKYARAVLRLGELAVPAD